MKGWLILPLLSLPWLSGESADVPAAPSAAETPFAVGEIASKLRAFRLVGDRLLFGDASAYEARMAMARTLASDFSAADPAVWADTNNAAALLQFVLFGGDVGPLRKTLASGKIAPSLQPAALALLAYSESKHDLARAHIGEIDRSALPDDVRHPMALVIGTLSAEAEPERAIASFEEVRIAAPGTALEEAALRQQVLTLLRLGTDGRTATGVRLLATYLRRYPGSIYWSQFAVLAAEAAARSGETTVADLTAADASVSSPAGSARYRQFLADIARAFLAAGDFAKSAELAAFVVAKAEEGSDAWRQADLYRHVVGASQPRPDASLAALNRLDPARYSPQEQALLTAAIRVAQDILRGYVPNPAADADAALRPQAAPPPTRNDASLKAAVEAAHPLSPELETRVRGALAEAGDALTKTSPLTKATP